ncbi:MAG: three-Cys-motif partner protein TcmP [Pseudomonadota bacterium]|nr:three-Cys-motif partner protein TcmP [Pseudomonadota bacterium]
MVKNGANIQVPSERNSDLAEVGPWAREKLGALKLYLEYYTTALKNKRWRKIYVDAYAGGGRAVLRKSSVKFTANDGMVLFDDVADGENIEFIDGSPRVALQLQNPFDRYVFIEPDKRRFEELRQLKSEFFGKRTIDLLNCSSSEGISWLLSKNLRRSTHRGVVFLDPFGADLPWSVVQRIGRTEMFEAVINFPLPMAIVRMLPNDGRVPEAWASRLNAFFGTSSWKDAVYQKNSEQLFEFPELVKIKDYDRKLLDLYISNLKLEYKNVASPRLIRNTKGTALYYLLWAGRHPLGLKGADHILKMGERVAIR